MVETGDTQTAMLELDQELLNDRRRRRMLDSPGGVFHVPRDRPPRGGQSWTTADASRGLDDARRTDLRGRR
jgi:hypothetical protein